jgi:hypothetical protein
MERKQLCSEGPVPVIVVVDDDIENADMLRRQIIVPEVIFHGASIRPRKTFLHRAHPLPSRLRVMPL